MTIRRTRQFTHDRPARYRTRDDDQPNSTQVVLAKISRIEGALLDLANKWSAGDNNATDDFQVSHVPGAMNDRRPTRTRDAEAERGTRQLITEFSGGGYYLVTTPQGNTQVFRAASSNNLLNNSNTTTIGNPPGGDDVRGSPLQVTGDAYFKKPIFQPSPLIAKLNADNRKRYNLE